MYTVTKKSLVTEAKLILIMDTMRDKLKVKRLLEQRQNYPTRIALHKLRKILITRRKSFK